jgi:hypothetical protein
MDYISGLPADMLRLISLNLLIPDINSLSQSSKKIALSLFNCDRFWDEIYIRDFTTHIDFNENTSKENYIKLYKKYHCYSRDKLANLLTEPLHSRDKGYHEKNIINLLEVLLESHEYLMYNKDFMTSMYNYADYMLKQDGIIHSAAVHVLTQYLGKYRHCETNHFCKDKDQTLKNV